ncbi:MULTISPECIES: VWA domain-containing protein [Spirulina sp. CCY15215]|uniref:VWA domain-containing protein n=1 Tax=Spirulina sp. CCY15215 TaxID=2767591 RepID=UPI00194E7F12|nr:VWA domain-containing protein [Spirulina major]
MLEARDYTLIIDRSASMSQCDRPDGKSRWQIMREATFALAQKCEEFDPDGITVYIFSGRFQRYDNVTADLVDRIFSENHPSGHTGLSGALEHALHNYFERKSQGIAQPNGEIFLVVTDGTFRDREAVARVIINASSQIEKDEELGISFIQVGSDRQVTDFLQWLDDDLLRAGAMFDIVDTITLDRMETMTLTEVLMNAIVD